MFYLIMFSLIKAGPPVGQSLKHFPGQSTAVGQGEQTSQPITDLSRCPGPSVLSVQRTVLLQNDCI